jgi:hypothetical protein
LGPWKNFLMFFEKIRGFRFFASLHPISREIKSKIIKSFTIDSNRIGL